MKVPATRLIKVLLALVYIDQTAFMPGKSDNIYLYRSFTQLQLPSHDSQSWVMVALDVKKAFDK